MAVCESIKRAMQALENECAWSECLAETLMMASGDDQSPPWVDLHRHQVRNLVKLANDLVEAINRSAT